MSGSSRAAVAGGSACLAALALSPLVAPTPAGAGQAPTGGLAARVTPSRGLVGGQTVTVTGRGFGKPPSKGAPAWFVTECTSGVRGHMNPTTDTAHCDITNALSSADLSERDLLHSFPRRGRHRRRRLLRDARSRLLRDRRRQRAGAGTVVPITFAVPSPAGSNSP